MTTTATALDVRMLDVPYSDRYAMIALGSDNRVAFRQRVEDHLHAGERDFVLDCREARYIDATGLGVILSMSRKITMAGGTLVVLGPNEDLTTLFTLMGMDALLTIRTVEQWIRDGGVS